VILKDVRKQIEQALESIDRLRGRSYHYTARKVVPPGSIVELPERGGPHEAYGRGMALWVVPFTVVVGAVDAQASEDQLSEYLDGSGPRSVVARVESYPYTAFDDLTVTGFEMMAMTFAGVPLLGATFTSEVVGRGA